MTQPNPAKQARNRILSALQSQQHRIARLDRENAELRRGLADLATAAGVQNHPRFAALVKRADEETPATTTEQARKPSATDSPENVGAAPAPVNEGVTPAATTDVSNSNVAVPQENLLDNLQDVTKPVSGTDTVPSGDAAHVETEVRVKAPTNDVMDPPGSSGWKNSSRQPEDRQERFMASLRLARLQIQAGLESEEDLVLGQRIADDTKVSLPEIKASASALASVAANKQPSRQETRHLVPRAAATRQPSFQQQPVQASAGSAGNDDEFMFGSVEQ